MLQAHYNGPLGENVQLLDGQLGFSRSGSIQSAADALRSGASAAGGSIVDTANKLGAGVAQGGKALPTAAGSIAKTSCALVQLPAARRGASWASNVPYAYAQGVSRSVAAGAGICNMASPPKPPGILTPSKRAPTSTQHKAPVICPEGTDVTVEWRRRDGAPGVRYGDQSPGPEWDDFQFVCRPRVAVTLPVTSTVTPTVPLLVAPPTPKPGFIQWKSSKDGLWHYAVPKTTGGLSAYDMALLGTGALGAQGFVSPWLKPSKFTSPYGVPPGQYKQAYWRRQYNWYDTNTADAPYRATWGISATHTEVGTGTTTKPEYKTVDEKTGKKATAPFYKTWWFWVAVAGGTAMLGTTSYLIFRRKGE